jgi:hypothetical protein
MYLVLARANFLDGWEGGPSPTQKNESREKLTPQEVVSLHPKNWMVETSSVTSASLRLRRLGLNHRLDVETDEGVKIVVFEARPNPAPLVADSLMSTLGERLSIQKRWW